MTFIRPPAAAMPLPTLLEQKLLVARRKSVVHYPTVLVHFRVWLDDVPGAPAGQVYDLVRPIQSVTVENNGYKEADTCDLELNYSDFSFDPRLVKNILVSVFVDYVDGLLPPSTAKQAEARVFSRDAKLIFEGYVDEYEITFSDDNGLCATMKARDYTGLMIDTKIVEGDFGVIRGNEKFTSIVKKLAERFQMKVKFSAGLEASCPTVSQYFDDKEHRLVEESSSYWDVIMKLAEMIGCITYVFGQYIYFGKPDPAMIRDTMYGEARSAETLIFVWGENIKELSMHRKYSQNNKYTNVEIIGYDEKNKKNFSVFWPDPPMDRYIRQAGGKLESSMQGGEASSQPSRVPARQSNAEKKAAGRTARPTTQDSNAGYTYSNAEKETITRQVYRLHAPLGCTDLKTLKEIAKGVWQNLCRSEIEGRMCIHGFSELMAGQAFQIILSKEHLKVLASYPDVAQRAKALQERGYHPSLAATLARAYKDWDDTYFYVLTARHKFTEGEGYDVEVDYVIFANTDVASRAEAKTAPATQRGGNGASSSAPATPYEQRQAPLRPGMDSQPQKATPQTPKGASVPSRLPLSGQRRKVN